MDYLRGRSRAREVWTVNITESQLAEMRSLTTEAKFGLYGYVRRNYVLVIENESK